MAGAFIRLGDKTSHGGTVIEASPHSTSGDIAVARMCDKTTCPMSGHGSNPIAEGDPVVTSGIRESLFPPDIPVGRVADVKRTPGSLQLDVRVEPAADLNRLQFVAVLRYLPAS